jgi:hypothetical protein
MDRKSLMILSFKINIFILDQSTYGFCLFLIPDTYATFKYPTAAAIHINSTKDINKKNVRFLVADHGNFDGL